jgi:hypothetical protein
VTLLYALLEHRGFTDEARDILALVRASVIRRLGAIPSSKATAAAR